MLDENKSFPREQMNDNLQELSDNIPGGMFSCRFDEALTLVQMNDGFLSMLGYTRQDVRERFHDSFWNMIDPRDRADALAEAVRQCAVRPEKELEYRMQRKDGSTIWVLDKGRLARDARGDSFFYCVLVDITRSKELEAKLRLSLERHQIIMDQTTDVLFEWDLSSDAFTFSNNWEKKFGSSPVTQNVSLYFGKEPYVYAEDRAAFSELLQRIRRGERYGEAEVRFLTKDTNEIWCRVRVTGMTDESGHVVRAVGVIIDIDAEKREAQHLKERAQRDALTKLYNKGACRERIEKALDGAGPECRFALFIIDLDDFKMVNDTMGHLFGDALLTEVAMTLQKQFRSRDVIGRVGGDEFLVFLDHIPDGPFVSEKAEQTMRALQEMVVRELAGVNLSCSIGVAVAPDCGTSYNELFQKADQALYQAKDLGKNRFVVFDPESPTAGYPLQGGAANTRIDSDEGQQQGMVASRLIEYVFRILYKSMDLDAAVNAILEVVGRQFDVSRVYIFEDIENGQYCCNTYEWCNEGIEPQRDNLQRVAYYDELGDNYRDNFNENGVFYCRDVTLLAPKQYEVLAPQGIKSMLQCAICDNGRITGFVGFDECRVNRFWTKEQVSALTMVAEILSVFLLKLRAQDRTAENTRAMEAILNGQSSWIYVVRPETFEMLYINRKTLEWVPEARLGMRCYEAFFHRDSPCEFCPAASLLDDSQPRCAHQIYNPLLKVWSSTDACRINWKGEEAILLTCHDITELKNELERLKKDKRDD